MNLPVVFAETALETFESIQSQIEEKWGTTVLHKFEKRTLKVLDNISKSPFIFSPINDIDNVRKAIINKNCSFFYQVNAHNIEVLFFWDNRQDPLI